MDLEHLFGFALQVWDLATYTVRHTLSGGHGGAAIHAVCAFGSGHTRALSGGADHAIRVRLFCLALLARFSDGF